MEIELNVMRNQIAATILAFLIFGITGCQEPKTIKDESAVKGELDTLKMTPTITDRKGIDGIDRIYVEYINPRLLSYLKKEHANWYIPDQSMWYPKLFNKYKSDSSLVNYITGDFDCNGQEDYALIVDKGNNALAAVAFLADNNGFKVEELTEVIPREGEKFDFTFKLYKPGSYNISDPDLSPTDPKQVNLKCPAIGIGSFKELYEGGNDVFYWDKNELKSCIIED